MFKDFKVAIIHILPRKHQIKKLQTTGCFKIKEADMWQKIPRNSKTMYKNLLGHKRTTNVENVDQWHLYTHKWVSLRMFFIAFASVSDVVIHSLL